jgi:pimeloyl-ACP methyl ester carboxylesterase
MLFQTTTCEIFYECSGSETGEPLLFLHGAMGSSKELEHLRAQYRDRRCLSIDFPSHGQSPAAGSSLDTEALARIVLDLLHHLGIVEIDIVGYSLGGYVAIEMALIKPSAARSIVSHAMKFFWTEEAIAEAARGLDWPSLALNERRVAKLNAIHTAGGAEAAVIMSRELIEGFRDRQLMIEDVRRIESPLLLSVGDQDELVSLAEIHRLYAGLRHEHTSLAIHPATRHPIHLLHAQHFAELVEQFWTANSSHRQRRLSTQHAA